MRDHAEEWTPAHGTGGRYEVTRSGRIRSLWSGRGPTGWRKRPIELAGSAQATGYRPVHLSTPDGSVVKFLHVIMLETFVGPRPDAQVARHLDGDPKNNSIENLSWGTCQENTHDAIRHDTLRRGEGVGNSKLTESEVRDIRADWDAGINNMSAYADLAGVSRRLVAKIGRREVWSWLPEKGQPAPADG